MAASSSLHDEPDDELVRRAQAGEREAFAEIYRRYHAVVYRFARMMSGAAAIGEDVTQETFTVFLRELHRYQPTCSRISTYLYGVARNLTRSALDPLVEESGRGSPVAAPVVVSTPLAGAADASPGYVIVPGPLVDPGALHVVRARMSRMALATLGVPIVRPDLDGLVEVEMLVGDDGVAQSIRDAALVQEQWGTGGER